MAISDLYTSGTQKNNVSHFAAIANIAAVDGKINKEEGLLLRKFANKLDISDAHYEEVLKDPTKYPIPSLHHKDERLEYIFELFQMIYADHEIDEPEAKLIYKYALGLGCSEERAKNVIAKSIKIFEGKFDFEDYKFLIEKK